MKRQTEWILNLWVQIFYFILFVTLPPEITDKKNTPVYFNWIFIVGFLKEIGGKKKKKLLELIKSLQKITSNKIINKIWCNFEYCMISNIILKFFTTASLTVLLHDSDCSNKSHFSPVEWNSDVNNKGSTNDWSCVS